MPKLGGDVTDTTAKKRKKTGLGRGLNALIPDFDTEETPPPAPPSDYYLCDVALIRPNRYQPRMRFNEDALSELAQSIREQGVIQPLVVRKLDDGYELIAGERRLRAAKQAGLDQVPVVVKEITDAHLLEMSIVENIQREDLNPLEASDAYHILMTEFQLTQEQVAERVGKKRPTITNFLRLRQLPEEIKESILDGDISMGHARALLGADTAAQQRAAWRAVVDKGLSVRETERLIQRLKKSEETPADPEPDPHAAYFSDLADGLARHFGTRVRIQKRGQKGRVEIEFYSDEDLDRLIKLLNG
jgi:ParB family transcriptional regulator, chromosome partitioning protein